MNDPKAEREAKSNVKPSPTEPDLTRRLEARQPDGRRPILMRQRWEALLFLHWLVPAARVQETLPANLSVDTFEGTAYLGIIPFFMRGVRPVALPAMPWISAFQELNVRTYVYDRNGTPGVWFYSLDCDQLLAVMIARVSTGLPYEHARMGAHRGDFIDYSSIRAGSQCVAHYRYRGFGENRTAEISSIEFFLLERYYLFAERAGRVLRAQVSHAPYEYRQAEVPAHSRIPAELDGFTKLSGEPVHACYVESVHVNIHGTQLVR